MEEFAKMGNTYVADGHHRTAAAYNVGKIRREKKLNEQGNLTGAEDFNFFMSILYQQDQLTVLPYNRVIRSLQGHSPSEFLGKLKERKIEVQKLDSKDQISPKEKQTFSLFLEKQWYNCKFDQSLLSTDPK